MTPLAQSSGPGFKVNGQYLTAEQARTRSTMLDGLLAYYYQRYSHGNCCGSVDNVFGKHQRHAISLQYEELQQLYSSELGKAPPTP